MIVFSSRLLVFLLLLLVAGASVPPSPESVRIVYVSRNRISNGEPGDLPGFGPQHRTTIVGGKLMLREKSGKVLALTDSTSFIDVADPCVSWEGKKILFSGVVHADSSWRIFEMSVSARQFRQVTLSDRQIDLSQFGEAAKLFERYDDFDPCYLPDGRIAFASTRYPSMAMAAQVRASNLYVINADGSDLHRITSERNGGEEPTIDPITGRIVYARWWVNIDRPSNRTRNNLSREDLTSLTTDIGNIWHAAAINPDGDALKLYAGFTRTREGTHTYKPALLSNGVLLSTYSAHTSLVPSLGGTGIRWFKPGADLAHFVMGVRSDEVSNAPQPPFAADPAELTSDKILMSYSPDGKEYGIYLVGIDGKGLRKLIDVPGMLELEPQVLASRTPPPTVPDLFVTPVFDLPPTEDPETFGRNDFFRFDCMNIFTNGKVDELMPDAPRIGQGLTIQFFMNPQRQSGSRPDPSILLKTAPVFYNGGVHEHDVPAEVPLFEQIVDAKGKVLETSDGKFAHVAGFNFARLGSGTKCVGCHIGHSMLEVPKNGEDAAWFNASPSANVTASSTFKDRRGILYASRNTIDRQARVGGDSAIWVANEGNGAWVELRWDFPLEANQLVLYNIPKNSSEGTTIVVNNCKIFLFSEGIEVARVITGPLRSTGTPISFTPTKIDAARITITDFSGTVKHKRVSGLAEIETIARLIVTTPH